MLNYYIHFRNPSSLRPPRQQYIDPATLGTKKGIIVLNTPIYPVSQGTWNILHHKLHIKCLYDIKFLLLCLKTKRTKMDISLCNGYVIILQCSPMCTSKTHYCQTVGILSTPFYSALAQESASTHSITCICICICKNTDAGYIKLWFNNLISIDFHSWLK